MAAQAGIEDGVINYPSGQMAVVVCKGDVGRVVTVYSDSSKPQVLAMFNTLGIGCVSYKNGKPWLVVTKDGWTLSGPKGDVIERGTFPRTGSEIRCEPTEHVLVTFSNRQQITVTFDCDGVRQMWDCGEHLKRKESHLDKVVGCGPNGKLQLDIAAIRHRQATTGSAYVPRGPHATPTEHTGLGSLKAALKTIRPGGAVQQAVEDLQRTDARVKLINTLPLPLYGTVRETAATASLTATARSTQDACDTTQTSLSSTQRTSCPLLPDFGQPPLSSKQRKWQRAGQAYGRPAPWVASRSRLVATTLSHVQSVIMSKEAPKDTLCCVCMLADWHPVCRRLQPKLEEGWGSIQADAAAHPEGASPRIQVLRLDASENNTLQKKYDFRTVPMFLMFYEGRLVYADNNISSKDDLFSACQRALVAGRKGEYLPDSFSFGGRDNALLNHINPLMTLTA